MAGTATITPTVGTSKPGPLIQRFDIAWTSDAADGTWTVTTPPINGVPEFFFQPGSGGTQPTNGYAVTAKNELGIDLLAGQASALSNVTPSGLCSAMSLKDGTTTTLVPAFVAGQLTIAGSGCGNSKTGTIRILWR